MTEPPTEDLTYNDVRFACVCGRFLAESAIRCTDRFDPTAYYGVATDVEWDCTRCGTVTDQIMPQIVVVGTHTFKAIKPPDEWIDPVTTDHAAQKLAEMRDLRGISTTEHEEHQP